MLTIIRKCYNLKRSCAPRWKSVFLLSSHARGIVTAYQRFWCAVTYPSHVTPLLPQVATFQNSHKINIEDKKTKNKSIWNFQHSPRRSQQNNPCSRTCSRFESWSSPEPLSDWAFSPSMLLFSSLKSWGWILSEANNLIAAFWLGFLL